MAWIHNYLFKRRNPDKPSVSIPPLEKAVGKNAQAASKMAGAIDEHLKEDDPFASMIHRMRNVQLERYVKKHGTLPGGK